MIYRNRSDSDTLRENMRANDDRIRRQIKEEKYGITSDIYEQMPWHCCDKDCPGWHLASYWVGAAGKDVTIDSYTDGEHDEITLDEIPGAEEVDEAWTRYYTDVAKTGLDPLRQLSGVSTTFKRKAVWQIRFRNSILGVKCVGIRRGSRGPWIHARKAPDYLAVFLELEPWSKSLRPDKPNWITRAAVDETGKWSIETLRQLAKESPECVVQKSDQYSALKILCRLSEVLPRSESAIAKDVKAAARKQLKRRAAYHP